MARGKRSESNVGRINAEGLHWCWRCTKYLVRESFPAQLLDAKGTRTTECTVCRRLRRYGLTKDTFALLPGAHSICPLCEERPSQHIDHDHNCCPGRISCGKCVRAVICSECNLVAGRIESLLRAGRLDRLVSYLEGDLTLV